MPPNFDLPRGDRDILVRLVEEEIERMKTDVENCTEKDEKASRFRRKRRNQIVRLRNIGAWLKED